MDSASALAQYQAAVQGQQSGAQMQTANEQALGVPQAQEQVSGLRQAITNTTNLLNQVAPSVYGRTQNSLVTTAQSGRIIQNEQQPLQTDISKNSTELTNRTSDLNILTGRAKDKTDLGMQDQANKLTGLKALYDAAYQREQDAKAQAFQQQQLAASANSSSSSGGSGAAAKTTTVNPQQDFLNYIGAQFKSAGTVSRQTQDAWANAFFAQHNIPVNARNAYWALFNSTWHRPSDPTKDYLYAR